jgi:hypothetical protein
MDAATLNSQAKEVLELTLDDIENVSGGYPVVPPPKPGGN